MFFKTQTIRKALEALQKLQVPLPMVFFIIMSLLPSKMVKLTQWRFFSSQ
jgi:hypothetical protein